MGSPLLTRLGIGASILAHIVVLLWLVYGTGVRLFAPVPSEAIAVELVPPEEAPPEPKIPEEQKKKDTLTQLDLSIPKPSLSDSPDKKSGAAETSKQAQADQPKPAEKATQTQKAPPQQSAPQQSASAPAAQQAPPPPSSQPSAPASPQIGSFTVNAPPVAQPDITEKYGALFGLSDEPGSSGDTVAAKIEASTVETFRLHLRKCSQLPPNITSSDKIRIVLRVALSPEGKLMAPPALIEASASAKGPFLMQAAIKALQACQPYDMLPAEKYKEWRVLDLSFTPQDFSGG
ncbi:MAG: hypothetical protein EKK40_13130 [Bradyrhizobiaceae bacterium]|nr:MAG: hypothetical protein EKK40_13130 [Bradyrhizobiaceae bacterium]